MMKPERSRAARVVCRKTKQQCFILEQLKQTRNPSLEKNSNFFLIWIKFWVLLEYNGTGANTLIFDLISKRLQTITPALHLQTLFLIGRIFFAYTSDKIDPLLCVTDIQTWVGFLCWDYWSCMSDKEWSGFGFMAQHCPAAQQMSNNVWLQRHFWMILGSRKQHFQQMQHLVLGECFELSNSIFIPFLLQKPGMQK